MKPPSDLPREELLKRAQQTLAYFKGFGQVSVYFKFTCEHCGARCTLSKPNVLYESGDCYKCKKNSKITKGGFSLGIDIIGRNKS